MPKLIIICGMSFAGKSTLGTAIAARFGYEQVDVDDTKFALYGPDIHDEELSRADWERIYHQTYRTIQEHLRAGRSVVDGSGNFRRGERRMVRELADPTRDESVTIVVDTPAAIARRRLLANRATPRGSTSAMTTSSTSCACGSRPPPPSTPCHTATAMTSKRGWTHAQRGWRLSRNRGNPPTAWIACYYCSPHASASAAPVSVATLPDGRVLGSDGTGASTANRPCR